jgi:hypothetical protein
MRTALWFVAAILLAAVAWALGISLNSGIGFALVVCWLIGAWRLATSSRRSADR